MPRSEAVCFVARVFLLNINSAIMTNAFCGIVGFCLFVSLLDFMGVVLLICHFLGNGWLIRKFCVYLPYLSSCALLADLYGGVQVGRLAVAGVE